MCTNYNTVKMNQSIYIYVYMNRLNYTLRYYYENITFGAASS